MNTYNRLMWLLVHCFILLVVIIGSLGAETDHCESLYTKVVMTKEKIYDYNGRNIRLICMGEILMSKCEGLCSSRVSPSVITFPGFRKDCKCCRESRLEDREITLTECYDDKMLVPGQFTHIYIREPTSCQCYNCAI